MRMWTRPPVKLRAGSSDRAPSYGPCGQALEKLALPHRLPTLGALAPTSSPLLQQRFMRTATAPTPTASQIAPSSQAIRLRNKPANSPGGSTRQSAKQHPPSRLTSFPSLGTTTASPSFAPPEQGNSPRAWTTSIAAPAPPLNGGEDEISQVPGRPLRTCPALRPRRTPDPRPLQGRRCGLPMD